MGKQTAQAKEVYYALELGNHSVHYIAYEH